MGQYESLGDENLLTLIAHGDKDALECFYEKYSTQVFSLARYMLKDEAIAEEIAQDVFLAVWQKAGTFKANRGSPKGWLMSIAHHRVIDHVRSAKRARASMERMAQEMVSLDKLYQVRTEDEALRSIERQEIAKALAEHTGGAENRYPDVLLSRLFSIGDCRNTRPAFGHCEDANSTGNAEAEVNLQKWGGGLVHEL